MVVKKAICAESLSKGNHTCIVPEKTAFLNETVFFPLPRPIAGLNDLVNSSDWTMPHGLRERVQMCGHFEECTM